MFARSPLFLCLLLIAIGGFAHPWAASASEQTVATNTAEPPVNAADGTPSPLKAAAWHYILLVMYCGMIVCASLFGGWLPSMIHLSHTRMQLIISFVGGLMLGIGLLHLLPHSAHELGSVNRAALWMLAGVMTMFILIRTFHVHHHGPVEMPPELQNHPATVAQAEHAHDHDHDHDHDNHGQEGKTSYYQSCEHTHQLSWLGITLGLALHTLIDGIALAASVQADSERIKTFSLLGVGTFLAILLHKPLDAVSITSLMAVGGWSPRWRNIINGGFAMMCPLGAVLFLFGVRQFGDSQQQIVGSVLAFSAGVFVCIALSDLLPEMEFHSHNRAQLSLTLAAGIGLAWGLTFLSPVHLHAPTAAPVAAPTVMIGEPQLSQP
ncbi:zinc transporter ZupT [Symmachiella macrocystis]|uniref:Zinc transporter ZupT n=1 Tax=Symmachiella macrocystis TaxID=2527985 RepID=A0A5C6B6L9_9PLAN|nr:ZIP family metal transporter [Symmachiella macrocystis]TWU06916.1 zinc transporter ZupT [Symmachiella macrocystis]